MAARSQRFLHAIHNSEEEVFGGEGKPSWHSFGNSISMSTVYVVGGSGEGSQGARTKGDRQGAAGSRPAYHQPRVQWPLPHHEWWLWRPSTSTRDDAQRHWYATHGRCCTGMWFRKSKYLCKLTHICTDDDRFPHWHVRSFGLPVLVYIHICMMMMILDVSCIR